MGVGSNVDRFVCQHRACLLTQLLDARLPLPLTA